MRRFTALLSILLLCALVLTGCGQAAAPSEAPADRLDRTGRYPLSEGGEAILDAPSFSGETPANDNHRVFYEIFTGSFSDSNGDGIGDLRGIINRMDYLSDGDPASGLSLGVEGI